MENIVHKKDRFGNDMCFRKFGELMLPVVSYRAVSPEELENVELRPDDVIVAGYPKSGNNWIHHMVSMLQAGTTQLPTMFGTNSFVYLEGIGGGIKLPPHDNPCVVFTHLPFHLLPRDVLKKKVKIIHLTRNPKDVFVSLFCHVRFLGPPATYDGTWDQFFSHVLEEGYWYGNVFDHMMDWQRDIDDHPDHPIFHCSFEDSKRDTLAQVEKLNQFLGTNRSRELCQAIADTCQFANMHVTRRWDEDNVKKFFLVKEKGASEFFRKGAVGDWKNWFTVAQNEQFDEVFNAKMAHYKRPVVFE